MATKFTDPAVVVVDVGSRWAISLLSGHEGGANDLAIRVANVFDAEAIITTTTEAVKPLIVGVGCRRGVSAIRIVDAIQQSMARVGMPVSHVRLLATATLKRHEEGFLQAAAQMAIPIRFFSLEEIERCHFPHENSEFVRKSIGVSAVAEPEALMTGRRTTLLLKRTTYNGINIAIARESCTSWRRSRESIGPRSSHGRTTSGKKHHPLPALASRGKRTDSPPKYSQRPKS